MISAIVVAAGKGSRMKAGINKQFIELDGKAIVLRTIQRLIADVLIDEVVVVIVKEEEAIYNKTVKPFLSKEKPIKIAYGGNERIDSARNGLNKVNQDAEIVIIHDGVRPFFTHMDIENVINGAKKYDGCIVGVMVKDTIKVRDENGFVVDTPDRTTLFAVHTPQAFKKEELIKAYENYDKLSGASIPTDDASLVEQNGGIILSVLGSYDNIKITTKEDLIFASSILEKYKEDM